MGMICHLLLDSIQFFQRAQTATCNGKSSPLHQNFAKTSQRFCSTLHRDSSVVFWLHHAAYRVTCLPSTSSCQLATSVSLSSGLLSCWYQHFSVFGLMVRGGCAPAAGHAHKPNQSRDATNDPEIPLRIVIHHRFVQEPLIVTRRSSRRKTADALSSRRLLPLFSSDFSTEPPLFR